MDKGPKFVEKLLNGPASACHRIVSVRSWPTPERCSLASRILASLPSDEASPPQRAARDFIGARRDTGPLEDAAVEMLA